MSAVSRLKVAAVALLSAVTSFTQVVIDNFEKNQASGTGAQSGSMLGGERDVLATGSALGEVRAGTFVYTATGAGSVELVWDGTDSTSGTIDTSGLGSLDLTSGGQDALLIGVNSSDAPVNLILTIHSGANTRAYTLPIPGGIATPTWYQIAYSDAGWSGSGNFTAVGAIQVVVTSGGAANVSFDFFRTSSTATPSTPDATLTDVLLVDADSNGKPSSGDTIKYVARIKNTGGSPIGNVQFSAPAVQNASAAVNITATPLARDDAASANSVEGDPFHTSFNSALNVSDGDPDEDLLNNDFVGEPAATITKFGGGTLGGSVDSNNAGSTATASGHSLTVNADGSFSYTPATGFTGPFTFEYRLGNSAGSSVATVTIAVGQRPNALADSRSVTGNVQIDTSTGTAFSLLDNDDGDAVTITPNTGATLGTVSISANGQFIYTPPRGKASGTDTFTYTLSNGFGSSSPATVTLNYDGNIVWFIDNSGASGDGRSHSPYNTIASFNTANVSGTNPDPQNGQPILLRRGSGAAYGTGISLRANQVLIGDGWSGGLSSLGFTLAPHSVVPALTGVDPVITPASGNGVNLSADNTVRGLTVHNSDGFGFSGTAVGNLTIAECSKTGTGGAMAISGSGSFGSNVSFDTLESTSSAAQNLLLQNVTGTLTVGSWGSGFASSAASSSAVAISGGSVSFTCAGAITKSNSGELLNITSGHVGSLTFQTGTLNASAGTGLAFNNADGTYNLNGLTTLSGGAVLNISNGSSGIFTFDTQVGITGTTVATPFLISSSTASVTYRGSLSQATASAPLVSIGSHSIGTVTFQTGSLSANIGTGLQFNNADGTYNFAGTVTLNGGDAGVDIINDSSGTFSFGAGTTVTHNNAGTAFNLNGSGANVTYSGSLTDNAGRVVDIDNHDSGTITFQTGSISATGASATGIRVANCNGGSVNFNGQVTLSTQGNTAVDLGTSNASGTVTFNPTGNGLDITTTTGTGFLATGGGTVVVQGAGNTINAANATALNIANTSIGGNNVTFQSISAGAGSNAGIILDNTGSNGRLMVTGFDGGDVGLAPDAGTGGTIANKTGSNVTNNNYPATISNTQGVGIFLRSTLNPSFAGMQLNDFSNFAILGDSVNGFTLAYSVISGTTGDDINNANDAVVHFQELTGAVSINNSSIAGGLEDIMRVINTSGTLNRLTIDTVTFGNMDEGNASGDNALFIQARNSAVVNVTIQDSSITSARGDMLQFDLTDTATGDLVMKRNTIHNSHPNVVTGGGGVTISGGGSPNAAPTLTYDIGGASSLDGNSFRGARGSALMVLFQTGAGQATGKIRNNTFGLSGGTQNSQMGSREASTIELRTEGRAGQTVLIDNNQIRQYGQNGIYVEFDGINTASSSGTIGQLNATISNNLIEQPNSNLATKSGIHVNFGATSGDTYTGAINITGNTAHAAGSTDTSAGSDYVLRQRASTTIGLPSYGGANNSNASVATYIQNGNTGTETVFVSNTVGTGGNGFVNASPVLPP